MYESYSTPAEIDARNEAAGRAKQLGYDNFDRDLTDEQKAAFRAEGREPAWRLRVPDEDLTYVDLIRGEVTFPAGSFPDFVVVRAGGVPLYPFVNPVDDALMGITHVIRGEDLMPSTARQLALYRALVDAGVTTFIPRFAHMPLVLGDEGNKKLSKRDPKADLFLQRERGFIREGLLNYLSLLGWSLSHDRDVFSLDELVAAFDIVDVNPNPARFDQKKAESINGDHIRMLEPADFAARIVPYLAAEGVLSVPLSDADEAMLNKAAPLIQERLQLLGDAPHLLRFLFTDEIFYTEDALAGLPDNTGVVLAASVGALALIPRGRVHRRRRAGGSRRCTHRGPRTQAACRVRTPPCRRERTPRLAAAVRVDGASGQGRVDPATLRARGVPRGIACSLGLAEALRSRRLDPWHGLLPSALGYGVIGNTEVSGTFVLGSSPGTPAIRKPPLSGGFSFALRRLHPRSGACGTPLSHVPPREDNEAMAATPLSPENQRELADLRARAYGPNADNSLDPQEVQRLTELEDRARPEAAIADVHRTLEWRERARSADATCALVARSAAFGHPRRHRRDRPRRRVGRARAGVAESARCPERRSERPERWRSDFRQPRRDRRGADAPRELPRPRRVVGSLVERCRVRPGDLRRRHVERIRVLATSAGSDGRGLDICRDPGDRWSRPAERQSGSLHPE